MDTSTEFYLFMMGITLIFLQIKHWYVDFVNQSNEEVAYKGEYLHWLGMKHSIKHGLATFLILYVVTGFNYLYFVLFLAVVDFLTHYHIDWVKMNYGNRDIRTPQFWNHLGLDQMAHQIVYILIAYLIT
jgi:hypothetical protein